MNLEYEILKEHSKRQAVKIANWVGSNPERFKQLIELFLRGEYRITQRSAWIVSHCADNYPELVLPWLPAMVKRMQDPAVHDAVRRNTLRFMAGFDVPQPILGNVVTLCFDYLNSRESPIAVKVHAMTVLANAAQKHPDLRHEIEDSIQAQMENAGPAIRARARMVLKKLQKIKTLNSKTRIGG